MESNFSDSMCRCCASEGVFKDFNSTYQWMGAEEVYADMLKDCFDITLTVSETINSGGICEVCITQLRNAFNFKKQVQYTEEQFKRKIEEMKFKTEIVKVEEAGEDDFPSDHNLSDDDFSSPEYDIPIIKMESSSESAKSKKRATKGATTRSKKAKTEDGETSAKRKKDANPKEPGGNSEGNEANGDKKYELEKTRKNLREIFSNSNATPIRCKGGIGYACSLCSNQYPEPADLKKHFLKKHDLTSSKNVSADLRCISGKELNKVCVKLDITNLICTRCYVDVDSIEELFDHIESVHNKTLHRNIKQYLVPFKFNTEKLRCCKCPSEFNSFKALLEHMNIHSENFVCNICCGGFINKAKLYIHKQGHNKGEFKCRYCDKVFETTVKKQCHERGAHTFLNALSKCWHCDERFNNHRQKAIHQQEVHGIPMKQQEKKACSICNRVFNNKNALNTHFRRVHLMERTHKCDHCDMTFFGRNALKKHVVKHTGERNFQCIHCMKAYGRKSTLREHLRIHMGDKRFKCNECGQAFVQKCSWRSHMRSKHGEDV
ncbi:zinc finger protein 260-like isoform X9 [Leptidea sinapis]|uniref:zinc finger protein 260-like isoform X9 n=1 Tax=Leptidea sinapis TaxID=189913 RepID=UPI0021C37EED|nr:zinc finger protein 260-like isoform X9 [Leptidea sinapis]